ncbi:MAG: 23S rRNA (uracil(1939)-C(5))-methyltransferase RlmD [Gammaproteobacteria bacterium]
MNTVVTKITSIKNTEQELTIDALTHEGRGVGTLSNGKRCFVSHALPGETVRVRISEDKRSMAIGELKEVMTKSPERVDAACPHFGVCGGCDLQHMHPAAQIKMKEAHLIEQLKHFGDVVAEEVTPALQGNTVGYRRRARIGMRYVNKKEKLLMGFREQSSRYLADCSTCAVIRPEFSEHWEEVRALFETFENRLDIAQLELSVGDDATSITVRHLSSIADKDIQALKAFAEKIGLHVYLQPKGPDTVHRLWPSTDTPMRLQYALGVEDITLKFHPNDFIQVNQGMNTAMVAQALNWLDVTKDDRVLDLFCGLGNFSLPLAKRAAHVVAVEGSEAMVERLMENAALNNITNIEGHAANLDDTELAAPWLVRSYDKVLIDPPRTGAKNILAHLKQWNPSRLVYVSCNPATLARDAGIFKEQGYRLVKVCAMDMFTHTQHTEAMALFVRGSHG